MSPASPRSTPDPFREDDRPAFEEEGRDWPNRACSRFVEAGGLRWHVQIAGQGPAVLLAHGTGAATHSWRDLLPRLARDFTVVAPDLPGHGFTATPPPDGLSLPGMAARLSALLDELRAQPVLAVGHSAGAAVLARMCLDGRIGPRALVSLNGALLPLHGLPGHIFSPVARLLAKSALVPQLFAWRARDRRLVERMLRETGSSLDPLGAELYGRLARTPKHVAAALGMMARWDLEPLERELRHLPVPLVLVVGTSDRTIPPGDAGRVRRLLPEARLVRLPGLGHLAHEEDPAAIVSLLEELAADAPAPA